MLGSTVFNPDDPVPSLSLGYTRIRDRILINKALKLKLEGMSESIILAAREIEHQAGVDLLLPGRSINIVADHYDAKGQTIDVSGQAGAPGRTGRTGSTGFASHSARIPGGPGGQGTPGLPGANAGSIRIVTQRLGDVRLIANGGMGGLGGDGGAGGKGGDGHKQVIDKFDEVKGSTGGSGGTAGNGGAGGEGGKIDVEFTAAGVPPPLLMEVKEGVAGAAGRGGTGGRSGENFEGPAHGTRGADGRPGAHGVVGSARLEPISLGAYWTHARERLGGSTTANWAAYRTLVGVYFYRQFKPNSQLQDRLRLATIEFDAVLKLVPGHREAARFSKQIELGQNVLGLSNELDLDPQFKEYLARYASFSTLIEGVYSQGLDLLLAGESQSLVKLEKALEMGKIHAEIAYGTIDHSAAEAGVKAAETAVGDVTARLDHLAERIKVASQKAPDDSISIGTIVATVGTVAAAVGSVIAAVPTAGASLFALAPSLAGLASELNTIGGHIFEATDTEKAALTAKYKAVGKNVGNVVEGVKSIVNLAQALDRLTQAKTDSNTEVIDLMRQGVHLSHELLIAKLRNQQAVLNQQAREAQVAGSIKLAKLASDQLEVLKKNEAILLAAGRTAIRATQRKIDANLIVSFKAARSLAIYTFIDKSEFVPFDTGFIHPDIEADFDEEEILTPELVAAYSSSFLSILDPLSLQNSFDDYFDSIGHSEFVAVNTLYSISDEVRLNAFKESRNGEHSCHIPCDYTAAF